MTTPARDVRARTQPRRGLRLLEAAIYIGVATTKFREMVAAGQMPPAKRVGGLPIWDVSELDAFFEALPSDDDAPARAGDWGKS
jgi:predicted DNA-binding transcriptional regulator AlpA